MITRSNAESLIPEDVQREIEKEVAQQSAALKLMRRLPNMTRGQRRMSVLSALPVAYFVDGEPGTADSGTNSAGMKKTTSMEWKNKYIYAEEVAVIAPIAEATLEDADYDIWAEIRPYIVEAFGKIIDGAVFFSSGAPTSWPDGLVDAAIAAGNSLALGAVGDLYDDIMAENGLIALVEDDGYFPTAHIAATTMRGKLRGLRDDNGQPIFKASAQGVTDYSLDGVPTEFPLNGAWEATEALMCTGDWRKAVYSIRKDMTWKVLEEAVIQDPDTGEIIYNLAQQDMVALRVYMRLGWQVPNPINRMNEVEANRFPFAVLTPSASA